MLVKARTGSGKTAAYAIPLVQKCLSIKKLKASKQSTSALVLTPSRELCSQACKNLQELMVYCQRELTLIDLSSSKMNFQSQRQMLLAKPDIVVSTPTQILNHLRGAQGAAGAETNGDANSTSVQAYAQDLRASLEMLVIDEADLLLSFGYEDEIRKLVK